jgi:hypothetical protein
MALSRESVVWGYRFILGREPESEAAIAAHIRAADLDALRRTLLASEEFARGIAEVVDAGHLDAARKRRLTHSPAQTGFKQADYAYVRLDEPEPGADFRTQFDALFAPQLSRDHDREAGFRAIFAALDDIAGRGALIVETGTLRVPGNWRGDGQSSFMFDAYVRLNGGAFFSIDANIESIDTARRACSGHTNLIHNDSVVALATLASLLDGRRVDLLYLDSFDIAAGDPMPSAIHHIMELAAIRPLLKSGSIVCVDDYRALGEVGGKGGIVDRYMASVDAAVLHDGYQKAWRIR